MGLALSPGTGDRKCWGCEGSLLYFLALSRLSRLMLSPTVDMTIPVGQAPVSHERGTRRGRGRARSRRARAAATTPAAPARGSAQGEDKDSLTVASPATVRRLGCRREDKDPPTFLIFPRSTTLPRRLPRLRSAMSAFSPLVDLEAERATGRKGMVLKVESH